LHVTIVNLYQKLTFDSQYPHEVQTIISNDKTPVLAGVIPAFEIFLSKWNRLIVAKPRLKPWIDVGLSWFTKYYWHLDFSDAYIIAMCKFCFIHEGRSIALKLSLD
jgi:hypothetical protein